jgi:putative transposase
LTVFRHSVKNEDLTPMLFDIDKLPDRVAEIFSIKPEEIFKSGKRPVKVRARSLLCYWADRDLEFTMANLAPKVRV